MNPIPLPPVNCAECVLVIWHPRTDKDGKIIQKYCNRTCKDRFNNRPKLKVNREALGEELKALLGRHGIRI